MKRLYIKYLLLWGVVIFTFSTAFSTVPSGYYYFVKNKKKAELKTAIHTYCAPMKEFDYGGGAGFTWEGFFSTDRRADSTVIDMYSNTLRKQTSFSAVSGMHIEHSFPKSWWGAYPNNAYKDLFHLYPADASANESKNNLPLGEVTGTPGFDNGVTKTGKNGFETAYTDACFEPADEYKGDFARSYFYIASVYENLAPLMQSPMVINGSTYPFWKPWAIDLLLKWNKQDPVSAKELTRIEAVYNIQGNRNPFIDYPDLAEYIWGKDTANVYPFPNETEPFLVTPRRGTTIDFGVILQIDTRTQNLHIQGVNLTSDLQVALLHNSSTLSLSTPTISSANALTGIDLGITFHPATSGITRDTLQITGGGLVESLRIPIKALASADFITLEPKDVTPVGGNLQWISDPLATNYRLNVYQGDQKAGDLIISAYVDGTSWNKALELFNGTGKTVDLSKYSLQKQSNGAGAFGSTLKLSGSLENNKSYVLVHKSCTTANLIAKAQLIADSVLSFNGNDAVALVRSGVIIDMVGKADSGANVTWGDKLTLQRKLSVTHPLSIYNQTEWDVLPNDAYSNLGSHAMTLVSSETPLLQNVLTGITTSYSLQNLLPENTYTYSIESMRSGVIATAINTMQLHTTGLDIPEISDPSDIKYNSFTANWGASPYATGYLLNVFKMSGKTDTTEVEGFDNVGASGTPLPTGWTGSATGNYTTVASSGVAAPSVAFKNAKESLQTKTYPQPVSQLSFMYRFATNVAGASLLVDGESNGNWLRIDSISCKSNAKFTPLYPLDKLKGYKSFRFIFNKLPGGNLAVDDVSAKYGNQDTVYMQKDVPVAASQLGISGLIENSQYFYNVRATLGTSVSGYSETIKAQTVVNTKTPDYYSPALKIVSVNNHVSIIGLHGDENIQIYTTTGVCFYQIKTSSSRLDIPLKKRGVFVVKVQNSEYKFTGKFIY